MYNVDGRAGRLFFVHICDYADFVDRTLTINRYGVRHILILGVGFSSKYP